MSFRLANVEEEYKKCVNLDQKDVEVISEWLKKQNHLPQLTELQIVLFLHSCYFRVEATKTTIDNYFTVRTLCPEIFSCPTEDTLRNIFSVGFIRVLPKLTPEGYAIFIMKLIDTSPKNYDCINLIKLINMVSTLYLHQNGSCNGFLVLFDMKGAALGHMAKINLMAMKKFLFHVQEGMPVRIKGLHVINVVFFADKLINMLKPFLKKELIDSIKFHPHSIESLYSFVPKSCLPEDYGGELNSIQCLHEDNVKNLLNNLEFFKWHDSQIVDETRRFGKPKNINEMFGVEGTFKKLEVD